MIIKLRYLLLAPLAIGLLLLAAALAGGRLTLPWVQATAPPPLADGRPIDQPVPVLDTGMVVYRDLSTRWDWQVAEGGSERLIQFLQDHEIPAQALTLVLVDEHVAELPFGVADVTDGVQTSVRGHCQAAAGAPVGGPDGAPDHTYLCNLGVETGEPGARLDVLASLIVPYIFMDMTYARGADPDAVRRGWTWATFSPLVSQEQNGWQGNFLQLWSAP